MKIDLSRLQNLKHLSGGKSTARCPACAADGGDAKGDHLAIFPDGKYGCVVNAKDKEHNKLILKLVGSKDRGDGGSGCRLSVNPMRVEESKVLMKVGRLGRVKPTPERTNDGSPVADGASPDPQEVEINRPEGPKFALGLVDDASVTAALSEDITDETLREFLGLAV